MAREPETILAVDDTPTNISSIAKTFTAAAILVLESEGRVDLDAPATDYLPGFPYPDITARHMLAHTSGLTLRGRAAPRSGVGERRVYSNAGYEVLAELLERRTGEPFTATLSRSVLDPLGMRDTSLEGSPASGAVGPIGDLAVLARELLAPRALPPVTVELLGAPAFPGLPGELPGFGLQEHNDWGLGAEIRAHKSPHWTSEDNSPRTFGHFGRAGGFLWVDPDAGAACVALTDRAFGPWAAEAWPRYTDAVLAELGA